MPRRSSVASKSSLDRSSSVEEKVTTPAQHVDSIKRKGSVRKRLSMLKMGMKGTKRGGIMGSVDEE